MESWQDGAGSTPQELWVLAARSGLHFGVCMSGLALWDFGISESCLARC
jgi:hypothetical protein